MCGDAGRRHRYQFDHSPRVLFNSDSVFRPPLKRFVSPTLSHVAGGPRIFPVFDGSSTSRLSILLDIIRCIKNLTLERFLLSDPVCNIDIAT